MPDSNTIYQSQYTGAQIDEAVKRALELLGIDYTYSEDAGNGFIIRKDNAYGIVSSEYLSELLTSQLESSNVTVSSDLTPIEARNIEPVAIGDTLTVAVSTLNAVINLVNNFNNTKLDKTGALDSTYFMNTFGSSRTFVPIPYGRVSFSELISILNKWYAEINNKLGTNSNISNLIVTPTSAIPFDPEDNPFTGSISLQDLVNILNGWYTQIVTDSNSLQSDGDGSNLTITARLGYGKPQPLPDYDITLNSLYEHLISWNGLVQDFELIADLQLRNSEWRENEIIIATDKNYTEFVINYVAYNSAGSPYTSTIPIGLTLKDNNDTTLLQITDGIPVGNITDQPRGWIYGKKMGNGIKIERQIKTLANANDDWGSIEGNYITSNSTEAIHTFILSKDAQVSLSGGYIKIYAR